MREAVEYVCACSHRFGAPTPETSSPLPCPSCGRMVEPSSVTSSPRAPGEEQVPVEWQPGEVYLDRYEVRRVLGQGAMGKVFLVHHRGWNQLLAVKCPRKDIIDAFGGAACFEHECETWIRVGIHPNTVACYYARTLGGLPRVFAEYVNGRTLYEWIHGLKLYTGRHREDLRRILQIAVQSAWGLGHAHRKGIIHQDVKPANIMMTKAGTPKVTDFGLARRSDTVGAQGWESSLAGTTLNIRGMTPAYCSPEQAFQDHITFKTDLWSWALSVFEMFTIDITWPSGNSAMDALDRYIGSSTRRPEAPPMPADLATLLRHCFQSDPKARPENMLAVAGEIIRIYERVLDEPFPLAEPPAIEANGDTLNNRAISMMDFGRKERAIKVWERALHEAPGHPQSAYNLSLTEWRDGSITDEDALKRLRSSSESRPDEPLPIFLQLRLHVERGAEVEVAACLDRLKAIAPETPGLDAIEATLARMRGHGRGLLRLWEGHGGAVSAMALDEQGGRLFTGGEDNRVLLWNAATGEAEAALDGHANTIVGLAWSPQLQRLASVSMERRLRLWDTATRECLATHATPSTRPRALVWLEERGLLLLGEGDGSLLAVSPVSGVALEPLGRVAGGLRQLQVSPAAGLAFAAAGGGELLALSLDNFSTLDTYRPHSSPVTALTVSPDGEWLASGDESGVVAVTNVARGAHVATLPARGHAVLACAFAGRSGLLLVLSRDHRLRLWDPVAPRCLWSVELAGEPLAPCAATLDGEHVYFALDGNRLGKAKVSAGHPFEQAPLMISKSVDSDEAVLLERELRSQLAEAAVCYREGRFAETVQRLYRIRERPEHSRRREVLQSWTHLYAKLPRAALRAVWETPPMAGHHGEVRALAASLQGQFLVSGGQDATLRVWDLATAKATRHFAGHSGPVTAIALSEQQELLISGSEDATIKAWDVRSGRCERTLQHPGGAPEAMALSPDGRMLATAGWETHVWDLKLGTRAGVLSGHEGGCSAVAWSRSGRMLVTGGADGRVAFWDTSTGTMLGARQCPHGPVTALVLSADESLLVSAGGNAWDRRGKACVWSVADGAVRRNIEAHGGPITRLALTLDNRFLFTAGVDGALATHRLDTGELLRTDTLGVAPGALLLTNDAARIVWSAPNGVLHVLQLDWTLEAVEPGRSMDSSARKLFALYGHGLRAFMNEHEKPAAPGTLRAAWPLRQAALPSFDERALKRFAYLAGCAGLGVLDMPQLKAAAQAFQASLEQERKERR
ncbi:MAG: hypothetical protein RLZZ303_3328 [Candidatus Hydrogenedentota bacterium]